MEGSERNPSPDRAEEPSALEREGQELVVSAMLHPLRRTILSVVADCAFEAGTGDRPAGEQAVTVRQLSARTGEASRRVRYHLDALCEQGLVEVVATKRQRGVVERSFVHTRLPMVQTDDVAGLSPTARKKIILACLRPIIADVTASLEVGAAIRRPDWVANRVPGEVDEQGREELAALHASCSMQAQEIVVRSLARMQETNEDPIRVVSANLFFERASADRVSRR
jgi:DNA-binding transcriptional ArsR family regulator